MARRQLNKREKKLKQHEEGEVPEVEEDVGKSKGFSFAQFGGGNQESDSSEREEEKAEEVKPVQSKKKKKKKKKQKKEEEKNNEDKLLDELISQTQKENPQQLLTQGRPIVSILSMHEQHFNADKEFRSLYQNRGLNPTVNQ